MASDAKQSSVPRATLDRFVAPLLATTAITHLRTSRLVDYTPLMVSREYIAGRLADEWLTMMSNITWHAHANSIRRREPMQYGETTSLSTEAGLLDVSDSYEWAAEAGGAIRLTIAVFDSPNEPALATRQRIIERPDAS